MGRIIALSPNHPITKELCSNHSTTRSSAPITSGPAAITQSPTAPPPSPLQTFTLHQLNEYIRRTIALNLPESVWIRCEIVQCQYSQGGHYFLSLIEKGEGETILAQANAILWATAYRRVRRMRGRQIDQLLKEGLEVLLRIKIDYHERFGFRMLIDDIDPAYTLGKLEQRRQEILTKLEAEDLLERNASLALPSVLQRVAVISSGQAAGYHDFQEQLRNNPYNYQFETTLFPAAMQGERTSEEVVLRLRQIAGRAAAFDALVIIRGGGARLDLIAFDDLEICRAVAKCPLPVLTGIGHEVDETVMDMVAHASLKTPTAVADFVLQHNVQFEGRLMQIGQFIQQYSTQRFYEHHRRLDGAEQVLRMSGRHLVQQAERQLDRLESLVAPLSQRRLSDAARQLDHLEQLVEWIGPEATLKRGYSILESDGEIIRSAAQLAKGRRFKARLQDGEIEGEVL
ncbi:MAG: exodeoxyribonuclease VII large subunit [Bacteroidota bacterium]